MSGHCRADQTVLERRLPMALGRREALFRNNPNVKPRVSHLQGEQLRTAEHIPHGAGCCILGYQKLSEKLEELEL